MKATMTYASVLTMVLAVAGVASAEGNGDKNGQANYYHSLAAISAKKPAPANLTQKQNELALGRIEWPAVLMDDAFADEREAINEAFRGRSPGDVGPSTAFYSTVHELTESLQAKLKNKLEVLDAAQYVAARNFVASLAYESQQPLVSRSVAFAK